MEKYNKIYRKSRFYWLWRTIVLWIGSSLGFLLIADISVGLTINSWETAFIAAGVVGILNTILWPLLSRILLPFGIHGWNRCLID